MRRRGGGKYLTLIDKEKDSIFVEERGCGKAGVSRVVEFGGVTS